MRVLAITVAALSLAPATAWAGGFEIADQGPRGAGRAGAFTVRADDPSAVDYNPAGLARMRGTRVYLANRFTYGNEEYKRARTLDWSDAAGGYPMRVDFPWVRNSTSFQWLGLMAAVTTDFGLEDWGFGLSVYGPPGVSAQSFPSDGPQKFMLFEREVVILYYTLSIARKYRDVFGFGVSLQWVDVPIFRFGLVVDGNTTPRLVNPVSGRFDMESRIDGADHVGFTAILGFWYKPAPGWELAASARVLPVPITAASHLTLTAQSLDLDSPPVTSRNGVPDDSVTFSMILPPRLRVGARYVHTVKEPVVTTEPAATGEPAVTERDREVFDLELDLGYEAWSMLDAFTMDGDGLVSEVLGTRVPVGTLRVPRNWRDTWSVRLGGDWQAVPDWLALRAGVMWESPSSSPEYSYLDVFPGHRLGVSAGFSFTVEGFDFSASYTYLFQLPVSVTEEESRVYQQAPGSACVAPYTDPQLCNEHYIGKPAAPANAGTYLSDYHFVSVSASYRF
jgi:long-chain fatty acid transport protein